MRDLLIFGIIFSLVPLMFRRPAIGALVFMWISLMNPHRLAYGAANSFPFAAMVGGITLLATVLTREKRHLPLTPVTVLLVLFALWMTLTSFFSLSPAIVWIEWNRVTKTLLMVTVTMLVIRTESDLKKMLWILGLSLGFYGAKGGLFTLMSGGNYRVWGPDGSYIAENNALALALVMAVPVIWYLRLQAQRRWLRHGLEAMAVLCMISAAGSYSRGALLGGAAVMGFLWLKSRNKASTGLILLAIIPIVLFAMPDQWLARMSGIGAYQSDDSALGRINAWYFAVAVANQNPLGGGFLVFNPVMFQVYAPDPLNFHVAHSIYFQVLGEHGYIGLLLFLGLLFATWRTASAIIRSSRQVPHLKWAVDLASMCQVSLVGYLVGGAFLSLAYYDYPYYLMAALVITQKILRAQRVPAARKSPVTTALHTSGTIAFKEENHHAQ